MYDILPILNEIDCGQHCDMVCMTQQGSEEHVKFISALMDDLADHQIDEVLDAICCAGTCKVPVTAEDVQSPWWWWK